MCEREEVKREGGRERDIVSEKGKIEGQTDRHRERKWRERERKKYSE